MKRSRMLFSEFIYLKTICFFCAPHLAKEKIDKKFEENLRTEFEQNNDRFAYSNKTWIMKNTSNLFGWENCFLSFSSCRLFFFISTRNKTTRKKKLFVMWAFETWATQDEHQMFVESEQTDYVNDIFMLDSGTAGSS